MALEQQNNRPNSTLNAEKRLKFQRFSGKAPPDDVRIELPIAYNVLTANSDEKKAMIDMLEKMPTSSPDTWNTSCWTGATIRRR